MRYKDMFGKEILLRDKVKYQYTTGGSSGCVVKLRSGTLGIKVDGRQRIYALSVFYKQTGKFRDGMWIYKLADGKEEKKDEE